jgi:hypothetical protein
LPVAPSDLVYGYVRGRYILAVGDTVSDFDRLPDIRPAVGTVRFRWLGSALVATQPIPTAVVPLIVDATIDPLTGDLLDEAGGVGVWLVAGRYEVTFRFVGVTVPSFQIEVFNTHTERAPLDLPGAAPLTPAPGERFIVNEQVYRDTLAAAQRAESAAASVVIPTDEQIAARVADPTSQTSRALEPRFLAKSATIDASQLPASAKSRSGARPVGQSEIVHSVKDYGAAGNGLTDDTAAVAAALAAIPSPPNAFGDVAMRLHFPAGRYVLAGPLATSKRVIVSGDGPQVTILYRKTGASGDFVTLSGPHSGIRDLTIDGNSSGVTSGDNLVLDAGYTWAANLFLTKAAGNGITVGKTGEAIAYRINDSLVRLSRGYGVHVIAASGSTDGMISNVDVGQSYLAGIRLSNGAQNLSLVHVWGSGIGATSDTPAGDKAGFWLNSSSNILVGWQSESNLGAGVVISSSGSNQNTLTGGRSWGNVGAGLSTFQASRTVVVGNSFYNNGVGNGSGTSAPAFAGIHLESSTENLVQGNSVFDDGSAVGSGTYTTAPPSPFPGRAASLTQSVGIAESGTSDQNLIVGNIVRRERTRTGTPLSLASGAGNGSRYEDNLTGAVAAPTVASAGTIRVPSTTSYVEVTGQVAISAIVLRPAGRQVTLRFTDAAPNRLVNGATLRLEGGVDWTPTQDDTITLVSTGAAWLETSRTAL